MAVRRAPRSRLRPHGRSDGRQVFLFDHSEVGHSAALVPGRAGHDETIFGSPALEDGTHEFSFPIDSTVESAFISVSLQCLQVVEIALPPERCFAIRIPRGLHQFRRRIVTMKKPAPGPWRVTVSGKGMFFLVAQQSPICRWTMRGSSRKAGGRARGLFPIKGQPRRGVQQMWRCAVRRPDARPALRFLLVAGRRCCNASRSRRGRRQRRRPHVCRKGDAAGAEFRWP
jgi:hypothetical protein